jgi:hypothetical protein
LPRGKHVREDTSRPEFSKQNYDSYESPSLFPLIHPFDIFDESPLRLTLANHTLPEGESLWGGIFPSLTSQVVFSCWVETRCRESTVIS